MSLLEQNTTEKKWMDNNITEFDVSNSKKKKIETICESVVYAKESKSGQLLKLYHCIF